MVNGERRPNGICLVVGCLLALMAFAVTDTRAETITFEEPIDFPETVTLQYCNLGVEFLTSHTIVQPAGGTFSPPNAATNDFPGNETGYTRETKIRFTAPQTSVSMYVGLNRDWLVPNPLIAELLAYSSSNAEGTILTSDVFVLGNLQTAINIPLSVTAPGAINSVKLRVWDPILESLGYETLDNLTFDTVGPPCGNDTGPPTVSITEPAVDGTQLDSTYYLLGIDAADELRLGVVDVEYYDAGDTLLKTSSLCQNEISCSRLFWTLAPPQTVRIRATAYDFFGNSTSTDRLVNLVLPGPDMNLWAESMEITQATQPWVPVNTTTRSGPVPTFQYPDPLLDGTAVPLVAGRTTVVRLTAGLEDAAPATKVIDVDANLRCFRDPSYSDPCPGLPVIWSESRPGKSSKKITVDDADTLDSKRRDTLKTWNFVLPESWVNQAPTGPHSFSVYLEAEVVASPSTPECDGCEDGANRMRVELISFRHLPDFSEGLVNMLRVERVDPSTGASHLPSDADLAPQIDYIRRVLPVDDSTVSSIMDTFTATAEFANGSWACKRVPSGVSSAYPSAPGGGCCADGRRVVNAHVGGDLDGDGDADCKFDRYSGYNGWVSTTVPYFARWASAHMLTHANGTQTDHPRVVLDHANHEIDWPWPETGIGAFGFDAVDFVVYPDVPLVCMTPGLCGNGIDDDAVGGIDDSCPTLGEFADPAWDPVDLMKNHSVPFCSRWISPRTWIRIYSVFADRPLPYPTSGSSSPAAPEAPPGGAGGHSAGTSTTTLSIHARRFAGQPWKFVSVLEQELDGFVNPGATGGAYTIELRSAGGTVLASTDVDATAGLDGEVPDPLEIFTAIELPNGVDSIEIRESGQLLAQRTRSAEAPFIQLRSPTVAGFSGTPPLVHWTAFDNDGDPLGFYVQYRTSPGKPWRTIGHVRETDRMVVPIDELPGGSDVSVRVLASDGFNVSRVDSPSFGVFRKVPRVELSHPADGTILVPEERSVARGLAFDLEDASVATTGLVWSSDLDGTLGSGRELDISVLSTGTHVLTLTATDSDGDSASQSVTVTMPVPVNRQPVADAGPDRTVEPGTAIVLSGAGSSDDDGDSLGFTWSVIAEPASEAAQLGSPEAMDTTFTGSAHGTYTIGLIVDDGEVGSFADTLVVTVCGAEVNDGVDNSCPGTAGEGLIDELTEPAGFPEPNQLSWSSQSGATLYQVARSTSADMSTDCTTFPTSSTSLVDLDDPASSAAFHYLARPVLPLVGSWGTDSDGIERSFTCGTETECGNGVDDDVDGLIDCLDSDCPCLEEWSVQDTFGDDLDASSLVRFFDDFVPAASDYIFFEIEIAGQRKSAMCAERADFYRSNYLALAAGGGTVVSGIWSRWFYGEGSWQAGSPFSVNLNHFGSACAPGQAFAWCPERGGMNGEIFPLQTGTCEVTTTNCGNGSSIARIRVSPSRNRACGF